MSDTLHDELHEMASRVRVVDLYDRILAKSRKRGWRDRTMGVTVAGLAVTGMVAAVVQLQPTNLPGPELSPSPSASTSAAPSLAPSLVPSRTPSGQPTDAVADLRNISLEVSIPAGTGTGTVTDGHGQVQINTLYNIDVVSAAYFRDRGIGVALLRIQDGNGSPLFRVHVYNRLTPSLADHVTIIEPDNYGLFYGATAVATRGGADIVITVNGAPLVYRQNSDGAWVKKG
jgi:hypothetical protein